ncbi:MAG: putative metal-binding motif-containing protein, partial [Candidatus Pacearchaeota archaeon]
LERVGKRVLYNFIYSAMIIMLVILVSGFVSAASITNSTADVAYIYKAKLKVDQNIVSLFKEMNLTVDLIDERYMPKSFSNYKFIFVGDERFTRSIPVNDYNSIVTNYYFGEQWGLTDHDGISNLASTSPLSVRKNDQVIQVYTQAKYPTGISIPYYYLGDENKVPAMEKVAGTFTGDEYDFGDVISYAQAGTHLVNGKNAKGNICFYGIVASKYWTDEAKQMFRDCINFVGTKCSKDLDCPEDSISVKYCNNSAVYQDSRDYFCFMPGTVKSQCNNNVISSLIETCEYGCLNGACLPECTIDSDCLLNQICSNQQCVNVTCKNDSECDDSNTHTQDKCNNPGTVNSTCSNTPINCLNNLECGADGLSGSLFCQNKDVVQNFLTFTCNNPGTVLSTCSNETAIQINKTCADACNNGACVAITCYNDSQCDDDNVKTIDQCLNPGTGASSCVHMPINCSLNSDCGTDGYLDLFCQSNNVFQNFLTFTCNNPGTANATCSSATNALLNRTCTYGCLNGACLPECTIDSDCLLNQICSNQQCVNVTCKNDSQCDDANPSTTDKCMNPGTVQSYCNNTFVKCNSNSECGTDGISGNAFCLGNSSYQNFLAYKCNNPGSGSSSCTTTTTPMLKQTCSLFCSNGDCVGCFSDENCGTDTFVGDKYCKSKDVYQDFEEFSCNSAGQVNSQCSSNTIPKLIKSCADSCYKGECKNVECTNTDDCDDNNAYTIDECNNPGTTSSYCTSTPVNCLSNNDCGITGFNGQEFCIGADVFKNYQESNCRNPGTRLSYCDISIAQQFIVGCGTGKTCSSGICMPVTCNSNSECGINRFLNQLSCSNNKIYDKFVTFTCNNPGTSISSCSSSNTDVVKQNCQYGCLGEACLPQCTQNSDCQAGQACLNNQCISIVCLGDSDCNDNNPKTADACINPGTIQSSCTHTPISCNSNAECGQNGFVDGLFCQSNNVFQNFMTYTCNNAGTIQSSCSGSVNALIKQTCTFGCSNGICNNNPCIDQDSDGYDTCSPGNPGDDGKQLDCNDNNFNVHPNAVEVCNLIDDN